MTLPAPDIYADFTLEGTNGAYTYGVNQFSSASAWLTAIGGTFARPSAAYRTNSFGFLESISSNNLRFDYNPITLAAQGILLENSGTNLCLNSGAVGSGAGWGNQGPITITTDGTLGPDNASSVNLISNTNSGNGFYYTPQTISGLTQNTVYACSIFVKFKTGAGWVWILGGASNQFAYFNVNTGVTGLSDAQFSNLAIIKYPNGWFRISAILTTNAGQTSTNMAIGLTDTNGSGSFTPSAANQQQVYVWGAQVEQLGFASSYIPTAASTANRSADDFRVIATSTLSPVAATLYSKVFYLTSQEVDVTQDDGLWQLHGTNSIGVDRFSTDLAFRSPTLNLDTGLTVGTSSRGIAAAFQVGDIAVVVDAGTPFLAGSLIAMPTNAALFLGLGTIGNAMNGNYQRFGYWSQRLSNSQIRDLTQPGTTLIFAYGPLVDTTLSIGPPSPPWSREKYRRYIDEVRATAKQGLAEDRKLTARERAERDYESAQEELATSENNLNHNLLASNYAKTVDAKERIKKARKDRDHHYYMDIVNKAWADFNK